jgi:hypothetical protein
LSSTGQRTENAALQRCDALRLEIEQRWEWLRATGRRTEQCIQQADRTLGGLHSRVLLGRVDEGRN